MRRILPLLITLSLLPPLARAEWVAISTEPGKRFEIDRGSSIFSGQEGVALGRMILSRAIIDHVSGAHYRIIETTSRFNCNERTYATLKRRYFKDEDELIRQEDIKIPHDIQIMAGSTYERFLNEVCQSKTKANDNAALPATKPQETTPPAAPDNEVPPTPPSTATPAHAIVKTMPIGKNSPEDHIQLIAEKLRAANNKLIQEATQKEQQKKIRARSRPSKDSAAPETATQSPTKQAKKTTTEPNTSWSYSGNSDPAHWGQLDPAYAECATGAQQTPIDIRAAIALDLEALQTNYAPMPFQVEDQQHSLQVNLSSGAFGLSEQHYALKQIVLHRPAETRINGKTYALEAQLIHQSVSGHYAILSVLMEEGKENPVIQTVLNHIPLRKGGSAYSGEHRIDLNHLLPEDRRYYTFLGSLTTPPCTENVLWVVFEQIKQVSAHQIAILSRLYKPNARPLQALNERIIKESR